MARSVQSHDPQTDERPSLHLVGEQPDVSAQAQKARPIKLLASDSTEDAAVCIFSSALDHFEANVPPFHAQQAPETVHQMRVALRRFRAALGLFKDALSGPAIASARERAKTLASALGHARNWDVFHEMLSEGPAAVLENDPGFYALLDAIELRRAKAYRAACEAVDGAETRAFLADFREAIAKRDWSAAPEATQEGSAEEFARAGLTKLRKRLLKKSKGLAKLTPDDRHEVRIVLKKARYAAEFFESLFDEEQAEDFSAALGKMQDGLGAYNDMETANTLLDEIDAEGGAALRASGFVRGWFAHAAQAGVAHAKKSEKRLKELEPFWE